MKDGYLFSGYNFVITGLDVLTYVRQESPEEHAAISIENLEQKTINYLSRKYIVLHLPDMPYESNRPSGYELLTDIKPGVLLID